MIPYGRQSIDEDDIQAVVDVLRSDFLTTGPKVREFEEALAAKCGAKEAVVVNSGTAALHTAYFAAGLGPGDEFITSPLTFAATANAGIYLGARPVFCDVEADTGNLDPDLLESLITPRTKLIVPMHYAGNPCRMKEIQSIADRHGISVIEDACHALGASYHGHPVGSCSHSKMAVFSFHPVKSITTGEGGAILTNDAVLAERMRQFREHGITKDPAKFTQEAEGPWHSEMQFLGMNYRLSDINCALGIRQLSRLDQFIHQRALRARRYLTLLSGMPNLVLPSITPGAQSAWHLFVLRLCPELADQREHWMSRLKQHGIGTQIHYRLVYQQPYHAAVLQAGTDCPNANEFSRTVFSIPLYPDLSDSDLSYIAEQCHQLARPENGA